MMTNPRLYLVASVVTVATGAGAVMAIAHESDRPATAEAQTVSTTPSSDTSAHKPLPSEWVWEKEPVSFDGMYGARE